MKNKFGVIFFLGFFFGFFPLGNMGKIHASPLTFLYCQLSEKAASAEKKETNSDKDSIKEYDDDFFEDDVEFFDDDLEDETVADPFYYWNVAMFVFNDKLYFWGLKPLAKGYSAVTPHLVRVGIKNFFRNIFMPARFVNATLQGKVQKSGVELLSFLINSTVGVLGFCNPAAKYSWGNPSVEDFGQTLGFYKVGNGFYLVWPFLGPSTLRDSVGLAGNWFLNPLAYIECQELVYGLSGLDKVNDVSFRIGDYESLKGAALDPYKAIRDAYIQMRKEKIKE